MIAVAHLLRAGRSSANCVRLRRRSPARGAFLALDVAQVRRSAGGFHDPRHRRGQHRRALHMIDQRDQRWRRQYRRRPQGGQTVAGRTRVARDSVRWPPSPRSTRPPASPPRRDSSPARHNWPFRWPGSAIAASRDVCVEGRNAIPPWAGRQGEIDGDALGQRRADGRQRSPHPLAAFPTALSARPTILNWPPPEAPICTCID